jgi:hypothetical protein
MRTLFVIAALITSSSAYAQNWNASPYNYNNSPHNYNSSPYNYNSSPYNYNNSPYDMNSRNGIYDNDGNRVGYGVQRSDEGKNYFDNSSNRSGYRPGF